MEYALYGALGVLVVLMLLGVGFVMGMMFEGMRQDRWEDNERKRREASRPQDERSRKAGAMPDSRETDERERREAMEQKAVERYFAEMLNYSEDIAYGTDAPLEELRKEGDR